MRVLQLTQRFPPAIGGVEDHVLHLAIGLRGAGVDVEVRTTDLRRAVPFERFDPGSEPYPFPVVRYRAHKFADVPNGLGIAAPSMLLDALDHHAEVIHAHAYGYFPTWVGSLARSLDGAALVITPHSDAGRPRVVKRVFDRVVSRFTVARAARAIALTRHEAAHLVSLGIEEERIAIIPNGVDLGEFGGVRPARTSKPKVTGLFVGRLEPHQKGLEPLVRSLAILPRSVGFELRIIGEDWGGAALVRRLASELGVDDRITLVGRVPRENLLREYAAADLLVMPSLFEPFGIVLLEAMASGLPVVASRVGGIPEVVVDGETGLLVEPGNASEIASAVLRLAESPGLRARMGARGRERARSYSWDVLVPRVLAVYREALQERA